MARAVTPAVSRPGDPRAPGPTCRAPAGGHQEHEQQQRHPQEPGRAGGSVGCGAGHRAQKAGRAAVRGAGELTGRCLQPRLCGCARSVNRFNAWLGLKSLEPPGQGISRSSRSIPSTEEKGWPCPLGGGWWAVAGYPLVPPPWFAFQSNSRGLWDIHFLPQTPGRALSPPRWKYRLRGRTLDREESKSWDGSLRTTTRESRTL